MATWRTSSTECQQGAHPLRLGGGTIRPLASNAHFVEDSESELELLLLTKSATCNRRNAPSPKRLRGSNRHFGGRAQAWAIMADAYDGEFVSSFYCRSPDLVTSNQFNSIETPEGWEPCTDGGFVRGVQPSGEPVTGPFGLLQARLFNHKFGYSSPRTKAGLTLGADSIEPFRLPPALAGEVSASSSSEILPTGVEAPAELDDSLEAFIAPPEACRDDGGCLGRRPAIAEPLVETASASHRVPQAPTAAIALAPGGAAPRRRV